MILGNEQKRKKLAKGFHRQIVGALIMDGKLLLKVLQGEEGMAGIEPFLILAVAALGLAIMPGRFNG